jgi:maltooligosyltrehalose trehalohydrolase
MKDVHRMAPLKIRHPITRNPEFPSDPNPRARMPWTPALGSWVDGSRVLFRVWAPERSRVDVVIEKPGFSETVPLARQRDGSFVGSTRLAIPGDLYRYRLDNAEMYPDPASRFQPEGVHGPSQIIDPAAFIWTDSHWKGIPREELILYELHVGSFTPEGTFDALRRKLPEIVELGVNAIELMPLGDFPGQWNWGYDGVAPFAPARCYGPPEDLRKLVNEAHRRGLAVFIDVVYNHLGPDGNYTGVYSPYYVTSRHKTFWGPAINFDSEHHAGTREFFIQNALHWVHEYHVDGLRFDATHAIIDQSDQPFLRELTVQVQASASRPVHLVAEDNRNWDALLRPVSAGGFGFSAVWSDDFHHQVRRITAGDKEGYFQDFSDSLTELADTLEHGWFYRGQPSVYFQHPRGTETAGLGLDQFVFFIQNHDQIGNRPFGERLHHQISPSLYRAATALLLTAPQIPLLFMGQEWGASNPFLYFTDHIEELGKAVAEGRKEEFKAFSSFGGSDIPNPQSPETYKRSKLDRSERLKEPHESVWLFYIALIALRKTQLLPWHEANDFSIETQGSSALVMKRRNPSHQPIWIVIEFQNAQAVDLNALEKISRPVDQSWDVLMTSEDKAFAPDPQRPVIHLSGPAPLIEFVRPGAVILLEKGGLL